MRKHDVRKWLHAILDLLPVFLIPVFMIYSHRHTLTERTDVDIQYKYESNEVITYDDVLEGNIYHLSINDNTMDEVALSNVDFTFNVLKVNSYDFQNYTFEFDEYLANVNDNQGEIALQFNFSNDFYTNFYVYLINDYDSDALVSFTLGAMDQYGFTLDCIIEVVYTNNKVSPSHIEYTDYNEIESVSVNDTNSDIMSVFMDDFNNAIDKYFNMGNVFNLGNIYNWFNTNIFGGNAPVVMFSVWNIVLYEFVMDLMFLLYGLFMWFIDMVEKLMEKPINSVR